MRTLTTRTFLSATTALAAAVGLTWVGVAPAGAAITSPASGAQLHGTVTFSDSGVSDGNLCLNGDKPNITFSLVNSANVTVWSQKITATGAQTSESVITQNYPNGAYTLKVAEVKRSGTLYCSNSTTNVAQPVTIANVAQLALTSPTTVAQNTATSVSATLIDPNLGTQVLAGQTVTFSVSGGASVSAVTNASGVATATLPIAGPPRGATVSANFAATAYYSAAAASNPITVDRDATATTVTSPTAVVHGQAASFQAHVGATEGTGTPTGTVQFKVDGADFGAPTALDASGNATSGATSTLSTGAHTVVAVYSGDANFKPSTSAGASQAVNKAATTTTLTDSQNPSAHGQSVTFTATVAVVAPGAGNPTGGVQFNVDGQPYGTAVPLSGDHATLTIANLHAGNHDIDATYNGNGDFASSSAATITHGVNKADTNVALSSSNASAVSGEPLTYTVKITPVAPGAGTPSGTVQFFADGDEIGDPVAIDAGGNATSEVVTLLVGSHTITANYSGDGDFAGGANVVTQHVAAAQVTTTLTTSPNPSVTGQAVTLHAEVAPVAPATGAPSGAIKFSVDGNVSFADLSNGSAEVEISDLGVGSHTITATYLSDDANFIAGASDQQTQTVNKAATKTTVTSSASPSVFGQPVTLTAQVEVLAPGAGSPSGTITFAEGSTVLGTVDVDSSTDEQASITVDDLSVATHAITATFSGDDSFAGSNGVVAQTVQRGHSATVVTSSAPSATSGERITFTATVSPVAPAAGTPTGSVSFTVNGAPLGQPVALVDGVATSPGFISLAPGAYEVIATYSGDSSFSGSTGGMDQGNGQVVTQGATTTSVATDASPAAFGAAVTFTATVTASAPAVGHPSGVVQFWEEGTLLGSANLTDSGSDAAQASFVSSTLTSGAHTITATYVGNYNFAGSTGSVAQTIGAAATVTGVTALRNPVNAGEDVELHASVASALPSTATPSGTVTFKNGATVLGTAPVQVVNGTPTAVLVVSGLHGGSYAVTAHYGGDAQFTASASSAYQVTVNRVQTVMEAITLNLPGPDLTDFVKVKGIVTDVYGAPIAGLPVDFTTTAVLGGAKVSVCSAVTDSNGLASCTNNVVSVIREIVANGYTATFEGDADFAPSTAHGNFKD